MTRETMQETVNMLSTPPTRRNRFMFGDNQNTMNDDSPILSQESMNISWKWNNEGTPIRPTNKVSKLRQRSIVNSSPAKQLHHLKRLTKKRNSGDSPIAPATVAGAGGCGASALTATSAITNAEPERNSPKGLYKFKEEMRKIQFDLESDTSCDNLNDNSVTMAETGYPMNADQTDVNHSDNLNAENNSMQPPQLPPPQLPSAGATIITSKKSEDNDFGNDLFNDSDFDQILLTCQIPVEKSTTTVSQTVTKQPTTSVQSTSGGNGSQLAVKKASSAPEIKTQSSHSDSNGSNWNLIDDDCFDDLVKDFDVDFPSDALNTSAIKFTRHKSMPQPQPSKSTSIASKSVVSMETTTTGEVAQQKQQQQQQPIACNQFGFNRKSFTRHESMPASNNTIRSIVNTSTANNSVRSNSSMFYWNFINFTLLY